MIQPKLFLDVLHKYSIDFFAGVPDSLLKNICAYILDNVDDKHHIISANEGAAIGVAAGYFLASKKIPVVYMQNSGLGNAINPLLSLADNDVYGIPILLLIGWRGKPGVKDEPQHFKQGLLTIPLLETLGIKNEILSQDEKDFQEQIAAATDYMKMTNQVFAFIIQKDSFYNYEVHKNIQFNFELTREEALYIVASSLDKDDIVISTTGMISRELFEYRELMKQGHEKDFLTVGSMGHASQIALGISLHKPNRKIYCFDGDGAVLMHMGSLAVTASKKPENYIHVLFNNGAHDSVGGQPTVAMDMSIHQVAEACGYNNAVSVSTKNELVQKIEFVKKVKGPVLLEIKVRKGYRADLGRPTKTPADNKESFMAFLND